MYAKQLTGDGGHTPSPFWLHVAKVEDTRLEPDQPSRAAWTFPESALHVTVQLWYRRFWQEVADARGWADNDVLVLEKRETRSNAGR